MKNYWNPQVTLIDEQDAFADFDMQFNGGSHEITEDTAYALYIELGKALEEFASNRALAAEEAAEEMEYNRMDRLTVHNGTVTNIHQAQKPTEE